MKLTDILKNEIKLFSLDIKTRLKNGQIEINGTKIKKDIDIDVEDKVILFDAGSFLAEQIVTNEIWKLRCQIIGIEALWSYDNDLSEFFSDFLFMKISKKEMFIIKIK